MNAKSVSFVEVKRAVSLEAVLRRYGILEGLARRGANLTGQCPFCDSKSERQFRVSLEKNAWYCFGCKQGGNVLDFVAKREGVGLRAAALAINEWFALGLANSGASRETRPPQSDRASCEADLSTMPKEPARDPAAPNPPLTFVLKTLDPAHPSLAALGLSEEVIRRFGLGFCSKGLLKGRIAVPIHNRGAELVAYAGLAPDPESAERYLFPPRFNGTLEIFNAQNVPASPGTGPVYLAGEILGVLQLAEQGFDRTLGLFDGTLSEGQEATLTELLEEGSLLILVGECFEPQAVARLASFFAVRRLRLDALVPEV